MIVHGICDSHSGLLNKLIAGGGRASAVVYYYRQKHVPPASTRHSRHSSPVAESRRGGRVRLSDRRSTIGVQRYIDINNYITL